MDLSSPNSTTNSPLTPVFGDNVQDLLNAGALQVNPSAIITVNSTNDGVDDLNSGVTTLRDAINQANADTGEDLIVFDRSLFSNQQTITLSGTELDLTHNLDIIAPRDSLTGADLVTVSGNKASRVFEIGSLATVSIDGLIVADGSVTGENGGGIKNSGTLTLDSSIVSNDGATAGGGIFNDNGANLLVRNSTISNNITYAISRSGDGGGIYNNGTVTVSNSTLSGNRALTTGGGIFSNGNLEVSNSTISGNVALENSTGGVPSSGSGGGIQISNGGFATVNNSTISSNSSGTGGGIGISDGGFATVNNSTISSNHAEFPGGGIFSNGNLEVNSSTISSNSGDGIYTGIITDISNREKSLNLKVSNSTISSNLGNGIENHAGNTEVSNSTLSGNSGSGIYNLSIATVSNSTLSGNTYFGIDNVYGGILTLVSSTITLNQTGGVYNTAAPLEKPGIASVRNTIIAANLNSKSGVNSDVLGDFTSNGYNLIGDGTGSTGFGATGDLVGTTDNPIDPRLAPLDFYGGTTQTIALLPDSPAIGAGDPTVLDTDTTTDQRGLPRRAADGSADIGAFELS